VMRAIILFGLALAAACGAQAQRTGTVPRPPPPQQRCVEVCKLSDAICRSKDDICRLAADLPGDTWAQGRCESARASCSDAAQRCTSCDAVTSRR
jgi:hypothetical protein